MWSKIEVRVGYNGWIYFVMFECSWTVMYLNKHQLRSVLYLIRSSNNQLIQGGYPERDIQSSSRRSSSRTVLFLSNIRCCTLRSVKFFHILKQSPCNWETTMHQNVFPTIFHTQSIRHHAWKTVNLLPAIHCNVVLPVFHAWCHIFCVWKIIWTTFWCIVVSQLQGDCFRMWENFRDRGSQSKTYAKP